MVIETSSICICGVCVFEDEGELAGGEAGKLPRVESRYGNVRRSRVANAIMEKKRTALRKGRRGRSEVFNSGGKACKSRRRCMRAREVKVSSEASSNSPLSSHSGLMRFRCRAT